MPRAGRDHARRAVDALIEPGATAPPQLTNTVFTSLEAAEWHVFKLGWRGRTGHELPID